MGKQLLSVEEGIAKRQAYQKEYAQRPGIKERNNLQDEMRRQRPGEKEKAAERQRAWRSIPANKLKRQAYDIKNLYGITLEQAGAIFLSQGGACAACGSRDMGRNGPVIDHDHNTGAVRGMLCVRCNLAIGLLGDDAGKAAAIVEYLKKNR